MPDFSARFTAGTTLETWDDPPTGAVPSRINASPLRPLKYRRGQVGVEIVLQATVDGVEGETDYNLGGRGFMCWFAEHPSGPRPNLKHAPDLSSVQRFTPTAAGHYTVVFRRWRGGGVILHVDVEA